MTAPTPREPEGHPAGSDVLSVEEEAALARIRAIVAGIRAQESNASIEAVEQALMAAGASREESPAKPEMRGFSLCGARFSVLAGRRGSVVEINFASER